MSELDKLNLDFYKSQSKQWEYFKKAFFKFLRAVPPTILEQWLIEANIIKQDYLTKENKMQNHKIKKSKNLK